jgi:DNA-directed RNA polymerase subunit RPC12/RpoP
MKKLDLSLPAGYVYICPECKKQFTLLLSKPVVKEVGQMYCPKCEAIFDTFDIPPQYKARTHFVGFDINSVQLEDLGETLVIDETFKQEGRKEGRKGPGRLIEIQTGPNRKV